MVDYIRNCFRDSDDMLPVTLSMRGGGGGSGFIAAVDEHGIIFVEHDSSASAIPWTAILRLKLQNH